jgi:Flp pilus assembly protein TadD
VDAHVNLAALLLAAGQIRQALPHFERAVELNPMSAAMESNLGGALAAGGFLNEAMVHVKRALALDPTYAPALDNQERLRRLGIR